MMRVDVVSRGNNEISVGMPELDDAVDGHADTGTQCLLFEFLPRDLLTQSILTNFLDGDSLANFWCAIVSKREIEVRRTSPRSSLPSPSSSAPLSMVEEIFHIIRRRRTFLMEEEEDEHFGSTNDNQRYCLRRQVFQAFEDATSIQSAVKDDDDDNDIAQLEDSDKISKIRTNKATQNELRDSVESSFDLGGFLRFSRRVFANLAAMDYCENVPHNLIWCGHLRIQHRHLGGMNYSEPIKVALVVHPRRWSMKEIRLWRNATTDVLSRDETNEEEEKPPLFKATVIPHNFLPVGPNRGRLVGLTKSGRKLLRDLSGGLNLSGQVGRFSCVTVSGITAANRGGQFTVKLMGFAQAESKLDTVFRRGYEPGGMSLREEKEGMVLHSLKGANCESDSLGINDDRNSLLCCWNHEFLWEDSRSFRMETTHALRGTMKEFNRLTK